MTRAAHGWEPFLDPGERLLWQGEPAPGWHVPNARAGAIGIFVLAFALFCLLMPSPTPRVPMLFDPSLMILAVGILCLIIGAVLTIYQFLWSPLILAKTRYALTDRRALLAQRLVGRSIASHDLRGCDPATLEPTRPRSVKITARDQTSSQVRPIRFGFIDDAEQVIALLKTLEARR